MTKRYASLLWHNGKKATFGKSLLDWVAHTINRPLFSVMTTDKKLGYHKPSPQMWTVMEACFNQGQNVNMPASFYVGDSAGGDDDQKGGVDNCFAENVSELKGSTLKFSAPEEFFGPSAKDQRSRTTKLTMGYEKPTDAVLSARKNLVSGTLKGPLLLLLCGAQGSGKSFLCEQLVKDNNQDWVCFSQDTINKGKPGKRKAVEAAAKEALQKGKCVAIDRMHLDEAQRAYFVDVAKSVGDVPVHVIGKRLSRLFPSVPGAKFLAND